MNYPNIQMDKKQKSNSKLNCFSCREDRIRTCDPLVPNQVRYRPALLPDPLLFSCLLLSITGTCTNFSGEGGIRTLGTELPVRQFSKLLISATHPPHRPSSKGVAKITRTKYKTQKAWLISKKEKTKRCLNR